MDMSSTRRVPAPRDAVWDALNDPETLKECVTGCERFDATADGAYQVIMVVKIGPIRARFNGRLQLLDLQAPQSYTLVFEGEGGMAGFAKGKAEVMLTSEGEETLLAYAANAQIGGKLAQIGSRLVDAAAAKMADDFFAKFARKLEATTAREEDVPGQEEKAPLPVQPGGGEEERPAA